MCDYSAESAKTRPAEVGERLRVTKISVHTQGFTAPRARRTAVCLCEGARLTLRGIPRHLHEYSGGAQAMATFTQRTEAEASLTDDINPEGFRDGIVFDGSTQFVSLQLLTRKTEVTVDSLPNEGEVRPEQTLPHVPVGRVPSLAIAA